MKKRKKILLTGATGYVGGRLLPLLLEDGWSVRCLARHPENLRSRVPKEVEVFEGDLLDSSSLGNSMEGIEAAFYLVHSMGGSGDFQDRDRRAAVNFREAAEAAGVRRIIYLGGLGEAGEDLSPHLRSRQEVGATLRAGRVPVIEFRASIIIGSGSLSFELIRALVERLPFMIMPRWVRVRAQPIAIDDVLSYLRLSLGLEGRGGAGTLKLVAGPAGNKRQGASRIGLIKNQVFEIGGPAQVSYGELMNEYAQLRGLRRMMLPVPFLTPRLSSLWLGLVTPVYARVGRKLVDSIRNPTVVRDEAARDLFPVQPLSAREAMERALHHENARFACTRWSDALSSSAVDPPQWGGVRFGNRLVDSRSLHMSVSPARVFAEVERIGGETGWHYANWLWTLRGWMDLCLGGVGMRRGRRDPESLGVGDPLDCWRVEALERPTVLRLRAEMKLPGRAWLAFEVQPEGDGARLVQTATFDPIGLAGLTYWYAVWPLHQLVFAGMLRGLASAARSNKGTDSPSKHGSGAS